MRNVLLGIFFQLHRGQFLHNDSAGTLFYSLLNKIVIDRFICKALVCVVDLFINFSKLFSTDFKSFLDSEDEFIAYSAAFRSEVKNILNTGSVGGLNALVNEMKENISKGISNTPDNLKTKLSTGGIELTWKELMNMQKTGEYIDKCLGAGGEGTYATYAMIGIAKAYVHKPGLDLTEEQVKFLSEAVEKKIDRKLETSKLLLELAGQI